MGGGNRIADHEKEKEEAHSYHVQDRKWKLWEQYKEVKKVYEAKWKADERDCGESNEYRF